MATQVKTTTSELGDSRVRVEVEVEPAAVDKALSQAAANLGRDLKIPGFRKGKVPPQVVLQRVGREAVLDEAVRQALPDWYEEAIGDAGLNTVGEPSLDLGELPDKGSPLAFSIEVGVRPEATLGDYKGLEVGRREPEVAKEEVDAEIERLREQAASLENVDRPAKQGDFVVIDFVGRVDGEPFEGGEARGYLLELGSNRLVEGFEEQLEGAGAGDDVTVNVTFPEDYRAENLAGNAASFEVSVKEVKEKQLPELDDDFATEAGGFDSLDELRQDIETRLREQHERMIDTEFREAVVDAAVAEATVDVPDELVHSKAHEMWHQTGRRLAAQGLDPARYLQMTGKNEEELVHEAEPEAERALKRESVLAAVVEAEGIEVPDEELLASLRAATQGPGRPETSERKLQKALDRAKAEGRDEALREDIAMRKAVDLMVESAKPITVEQAQARDKLWTPGKEDDEGAKEIWTPGG
ncbi:MAG: trigger factor [Thermoleophilaceae bacterium]|jgi:trigger factor|nr:trigger factor [Thermoleophilaceae bacterium]